MKNILVTGTNKGIGLEIVKQYAKEGNIVFACCRHPNHAIELHKLSQINNKIQIYELDVSNLQKITQLAQQLNNIPIDILINNAAVAGDDVFIGAIDYEDLLATLKINTLGPIMMAQTFLEHIAKSKTKLIVNMSSVLGSIGLHQDKGWGWFSYRVSKSALNSATRCMANQLKERGIIAVSMHPGWVKTDMGGEEADISTEESVLGMRHILSKITMKDSGSFLAYDGEVLEW